MSSTQFVFEFGEEIKVRRSELRWMIWCSIWDRWGSYGDVWVKSDEYCVVEVKSGECGEVGDYSNTQHLLSITRWTREHCPEARGHLHGDSASLFFCIRFQSTRFCDTLSPIDGFSSLQSWSDHRRPPEWPSDLMTLPTYFIFLHYSDGYNQYISTAWFLNFLLRIHVTQPCVHVSPWSQPLWENVRMLLATRWMVTRLCIATMVWTSSIC